MTKPLYSPGLVTSWDKQAPLPPAHIPPIAVDLRVQRTYYDDSPSSSWLMTWCSKRLVRRHFERVRQHFPYLTNADSGSEHFPYRLVIEATHGHRCSKAAEYANALSLTLVPYTVEYSLQLDAKLFRGSDLLKTYRARGTYDTCYELLLIWPVGWRSTTTNQMMENTFWDLFLQLHRDAESLFPVTPT